MIVTLTGENDYLINTELHSRIDSYVKEYGDLGLEKIDGEDSDTEKIRGSLNSLPFLSSKKLVVLSNPSKQKQFIENFGKTLELIPESTDVIIVEKKVDKRLSYYKELKKSTDFRELGLLDANSLASWITQYAKSSGGQINLSDAQYLIDRAGLNQLMLKNEIDKLLNYSKSIDRKSIQLMTERLPQSTVFDLLEAAFSGNRKKSLAIYREQRALKVEPQIIIGTLSWQLHLLALIKAFGNASSVEIAKSAKLHPYVVTKSQNIASRLPMGLIKLNIRKLLELDMQLKTTSVDVDEAIMGYIMNLEY